MYLKCYYNHKKQIASIEEVEAALPKDMQGLKVDKDLGYPCVEFPENATYADWEKVQQALQGAGFETE